VLGLEQRAERRILEAIERGELSDLPGAGRPLDLDDDALVPPELRMAYRIVKNAGLVPPEVEALRDLAALERIVRDAGSDEERTRALRRLDLLLARLDRRPGSPPPRILLAYRDRIIEKLDRSGRAARD